MNHHPRVVAHCPTMRANDYSPYVKTIVRSGDDQYPMHMVRHDDEFIQRHLGKMHGDFPPASFDHAACVVPFHRVAHDAPEETRMALGAHRHEIRTGLIVIVPGQSDRPALVFIRIVWHSHALIQADARFYKPVVTP